MRCKACNYSLWKLTEHRCPECGRAFDPANPKTFRGKPKEPVHWGCYVMFLLVMLFLVCWIVMLMLPAVAV